MFTLYSTAGCRACQYAKLAFEDYGEEDNVTVVTVADAHHREALRALYGAKSFPIVLLDGKYIGGFTELATLLAERDG